ncbi:MarR family winged helix-turn-helix transcriptional regulator [Frankia sp. Cr1]|uniref:MarR family winged helix-turn-helix transcriptional regulator n=1 Tax=Frankia sp. Cr1 TaxID=3073931 RepID=UPI002AD36E35|nr:MarR family transcriptional regulator [Frankia sp. Cr1]
MTSGDSDAVAQTGDRQREFSLRLDDQLCFALYAASRAVTAVYRPVLDRLGLTYPQYLVMLVLWDHETSLVKDLCAALALDYGTLSPLLKRLESTGLLRRERRVDDERSVQVTLTETGAALRERARAVPAVIGGAMSLSDDEFVALRTALRSLTAAVTATAEAR